MVIPPTADDGIVPLAPSDIEATPRVIHPRGRKCRYQEIAPTEVVKLLQNPMGTIPISRPYLPDPAPPTPTLEDLISGFRDAK